MESEEKTLSRIETPVLIVGGGGCGLSSSIFLSDLGVAHYLIERHDDTSYLPKAHFLNQRTMEIARSHNFDAEIYAAGAGPEHFGRISWVTSLGGDGPFDRKRLGTLDAFGGGTLAPRYARDSPCLGTNLPQLRLEPILKRIATERAPESIHFGHELVSWEDRPEGVVAQITDRFRGETYEVLAQYVIGADGGKTLPAACGAQMVGPTNMLEMVSAHFAADLSEYVDGESMIIWSVNARAEGSWRSGSLVQMGPTWGRHSEEWVCHFSFRPDDPARSDETAILPRLRELFNLPDVEIELKRISHWNLDRVVADHFRFGRVFLAGDAAHRQPPTTGLGLNGAVQDAHNLCWKLAEVVAGRASDALLDTYEAERLPVDTLNADWAMSCFLNHPVLEVGMGFLPGAPPEANFGALAAFFSEGRIGESTRARSAEVTNTQRVEYQAHDIELGFNYASASVLDDGTPPVERDPMGLEYTPTTRPGHRLPHAWLDHGGRRISTHDLITPGTFALIAGSGGEAWSHAATEAAIELGINLTAVIIGVGVTVEVDGQWSPVSELSAGGAMLVRPDHHIAWRSVGPAPAEATELLLEAMGCVLAAAAPDR